MVVPLAPISSLMALTTTWMLASLLPQTTRAWPLLATAPRRPVRSLCPVWHRKWKVQKQRLRVWRGAQALRPSFGGFMGEAVIGIATGEAQHTFKVEMAADGGLIALTRLFSAYCAANSTGLSQVPRKSALRLTMVLPYRNGRREGPFFHKRLRWPAAYRCS